MTLVLAELDTPLETLPSIAFRRDVSGSQNHPVRLSPSVLPSAASITFEKSSFFTRHGSWHSLPSPAEVLADASRQHPDGRPNSVKPPPVH
jgi:hypothetical protein